MQKKELILSFITLLLIGAMLANEALSKCIHEEYGIIGRIYDSESKKPVAKVKMFFFFDDYDTTWSNGYETKYPDFFESQSDGTFKASAYFNTFSNCSQRNGHECDATPKLLTVIATAPGYLTRRVVFKEKDLKAKQVGEIQTINLSPIELTRSN